VGGAANGLFAEYGLDIEILEPAGGPANVARVASGATDFCLTSVSHFLKAQKQVRLPARFVAMVVQRSPMAGFVAAGSQFREAADLGDARLGGAAGNELVAQFQAALAHRGVGPSPLVPVPYADAPAALGGGEIDVVADYIDLLPRIRRQAGTPLRAIAVGPDAYSSGLVAGDSVSTDLVATMRVALAAALEHQRADPEWGVAALCDRYPDVDPVDAREGWALAEPNIFTGVAPGSMSASRWRFTLEHLAAAYGTVALPAETTYREEFLSPATDRREAVAGNT
jgi:ABC-type nitrate/sulfonate/bicarbonate transport system substrate-binding protein